MEEKEKVKVKLKEYDEVFCSKPSCHKVLNVKDTLTMLDGQRGYLTCPDCGHRTRVVKTRSIDDDYNVDKNGTRVRKVAKEHMTKKQRKRMNKELRIARLEL